MTEAEAIAEAAKRERHKSKHMTHKRWQAVHNSVKGWHVALVDNFKPVEQPQITLEGVSLAVMLFGPDATVRALAHIARERKPKS